MTEHNFLIKMRDGGIIEIIQDHHSFSGCDTCDYGSKYTNELTIKMTSMEIEVEINEMYDYAVSDSDLMRFFLQNVSEIEKLKEKEFENYLKKGLNEMVDDHPYRDTNIEFRVIPQEESLF